MPRRPADARPDVIDWASPWFAPLQQHGASAWARIVAGAPLHEALNAAQGAPVRFVEQAAPPPGLAYERYVFESRQCPVREGLHDFFNGLCWMAWPQTKTALNRLQASQIELHGVGPRRGAVRDAITVFDENGAVLQAPDALWAALVARDWRKLFVDLRPLWPGARLHLLGHALLEQLVAPRKGLTAHVLRANAQGVAAAELDGWLAAQMTGATLAAKPFTPLPVLGVPGWWPGNAEFSFYDDRHVFRPARTAQNP